MPGQFLNVEEVAQLLKLTNAEVVQLSNTGKIHGYRDGSTWKYKKEAIEEYIKKQREAAKPPKDDYGFGDSGVGETLPSGSDIMLRMGDDDQDDAIPASTGFSDINLTLDGDVSLAEDSSAQLDFGDDADLVLGEEDGVGQGSGMLLGEGSGISLMSANDSGISLEGGDAEVLELGDDDVLAMSSSISGMGMGGDEDFNLTPKEFGDDDDDSGSQVIVLDHSTSGSGFGDDHDMFSENLGGPTDEMGVLPMANQLMYSDAGLPEKPYSIWNLVGLGCCALVLMLTLLFSVDMLRNMWSWDKPTQFNSAMMDWILSLIAGK